MSGAGQLRESVSYAERRPGNDGLPGSPDIPGIGPHVTLWTAPARIKTLVGGSEAVVAGRLVGKQTHVITIRYNPEAATMTSGGRLCDERAGYTPDGSPTGAPNRSFNIRAVTIDERKAFIDVLVETGVV